MGEADGTTAPETARSDGREAGVLLPFLAVAGSYAVNSALAFLASVAAARTLGPEPFGAIGVAQHTAAAAGVVGAVGLDIVAVREWTRLPPHARSAAAFTAPRVVCTLLACALLLAFAWATPQLRPIVLLVAIMNLRVLAAAASLSWVAQAEDRMVILGMLGVLPQAAAFALVEVALALSWGAAGVCWAFAAGELAALVAWVAWARGRGVRIGPWPSLRRMAATIREALPVGISQCLRLASMGSDLILIGLLAPLYEAGWYTSAYKLYLLATSVVAAYFVVLFPRLARRAAASPHGVRGAVDASARTWLLVCTPAAALAVWFAPWGLEALWGPLFVAAAAPLRILVAAFLLYVVNIHLRNEALAQGRSRDDLRSVAAGAAVHVAAKVALIPVMGIAGAAVGTVAGEAAQLAVSLATRSRRGSPTP